ncbi:type II toxin-antitoxin system VapC family toxin [Candidatus Poriferisodalis sp.]|uniref:type II toxin-antitoxin system VapC family toxin n=1 Tax=Candidatus Poriferisodalis sp. TaxID=3101277 RepID=UPI003B52C023
MFILDTNVVSEVMRPQPQAEVLAWIDRRLTDDLYVTAVTEAEIRTGIAILPEGTRRRGLTTAAAHAFGVLFAGRVLPFDSDAAQAFAVIAATRRSIGHPISQADCQIAAIARSVSASIATRNVSDFEGCGIDVINPWN